MKPHHHPDIATLMAYSAGALSSAFSAVVSAHLSVCRTCRDRVRDTDAIGGQLLNQQEGMPLSPGAHENCSPVYSNTRRTPYPLHRRYLPGTTPTCCLPRSGRTSGAHIVRYRGSGSGRASITSAHAT